MNQFNVQVSLFGLHYWKKKTFKLVIYQYAHVSKDCLPHFVTPCNSLAPFYTRIGNTLTLWFSVTVC